MLATCITDEVLIRLFQRHFPDPVSALLRLEKHLASIPLSFNLKAQLRELSFPPQPGLANGVPSFIYYFLPDSGWGSDKQVPTNPLDANFVKGTDGISLNLGCPVRLLRALDVLAQLRSEDQKEIKASLLNPTQHFAAIEELLWPTVWKSPSDLRRGGTIPGAKGNVDWALKSSGFPLYLEAKFRPSDWPRLSDQGTFTPIAGSFLGKAAHKFPNPPHQAALYFVGITTYDNLTEAILDQIGQELQTHPQVHGVIFRSFAQMTHVLSLDLGLRDRIFTLLAKPSARDYPTNYAVFTHIEQRDKRVVERAKNNNMPRKATSPVFCWPLQPQIDTPIIILGDAYRMNIVSRGPGGEPRFQVVPKRIWVADNSLGGKAR
jgi:hypothetical protein